MHIGPDKHGADGHAAAGRIQVQFVALPSDLVALRVFLCVRSESCVDLSEHFRQRLATLALQWAGLWGGAYFAFLRATPFVSELRWDYFGLVFFAIDSRGLQIQYRFG